MLSVFISAFPEQNDVGVFADAFPLTPFPPALVGASLNKLRNQLSMFFDQDVTGTAVPTLTFSGGAVTASFLSLVNSTVRLSLSREILSSETGSLLLSAGSYTSVLTGEKNSQTSLSVNLPAVSINNDIGSAHSLFGNRIAGNLAGRLVELN